MMALNELAKEINQISRDKGFWDGEARNFGEAIALMHSELSEALEEDREGNPAVWHSLKLPNDFSQEVTITGEDREFAITEGRVEATGAVPKPEGWAVELIDCMIRILDYLGASFVDIDAVLAEKVAYNKSRPRKHGKRY